MQEGSYSLLLRVLTQTEGKTIGAYVQLGRRPSLRQGGYRICLLLLDLIRRYGRVHGQARSIGRSDWKSSSANKFGLGSASTAVMALGGVVAAKASPQIAESPDQCYRRGPIVPPPSSISSSLRRCPTFVLLKHTSSASPPSSTLLHSPSRFFSSCAPAVEHCFHE